VINKRVCGLHVPQCYADTHAGRQTQNVLVIYFCFRDVREINRSYNTTGKSQKQRINVIEMMNCLAPQGHRT
jgi:hypothetical protein